MLRHRYNVGASHFSDGDTSIGLVCSIEVDVIRSNAGGDCELELLSFSEPFSGEVTWMETDSSERLASMSRNGMSDNTLIPLICHLRSKYCKTHGVVMMTSESTSS